MELAWILIGSTVASFCSLACAIASLIIDRKLQKKKEKDLASIQKPSEIYILDKDVERLLNESCHQHYNLYAANLRPVQAEAKTAVAQMNLFEPDEVQSSPTSSALMKPTVKKQPMKKAGPPTPTKDHKAA